MFELTAKTPAGSALVRLAETLASDLAGRAAVHDREATYPHASITALRREGYFNAPIPTEYGGLGVTSVHDVLVASSRLARGDASVAIGVNMHLAVVLNMVRRWQIAVNAGDERRRRAFGMSLESLARNGAVIATAISEFGQDLARPSTVATRTDDGWRIDGRKAFCTMSPAATVLFTAVTFVDDDGVERYGYAQVPAGTPGVTIHDDWDAVGMRASGSHSVSYDGVELPAAALRGGFRIGETSAYLERNLEAGLFHASASLGIAESAAETATRALAARNGHAHDARTKSLLAENAIELTACRATLARAGSLIDEHNELHPTAVGTPDEIMALFAQAQAAKAFLNEASARIVDRALALSGGAGYFNTHPLARAYRDVRAGSFMHPLGANRAYEFLGEVALGRRPTLH
jgi:alkylation response protein AidB-like acyl-CoA dehydrogenase